MTQESITMTCIVCEKPVEENEPHWENGFGESICKDCGPCTEELAVLNSPERGRLIRARQTPLEEKACLLQEGN